ncbi:MAG: DNA repair protein RadC [Kofleriaceae bacterium]
MQAADHGERPRERLWRRGCDQVSDAELLALVLGTGRPGRSATAVAHDILAEVGGMHGLSRVGPEQLAEVAGVGPARAARLVAAIGLGVRAVDRGRTQPAVLHCAEDVRRRVWPRLVGLAQEVFVVIGIDARNGVVVERDIARGHLTGVDVHPREVFRPLLRAGAAAGVCVHNHPSGDPTPSDQDLALTARLKELGELVGIPIIDHVVVADDGLVSIAAWAAGQPPVTTGT